LILLFLLVFCALAFAQQADRMTAMINAPRVTFNQAAYFASSYLGLGSENMSDAEAGKMLAAFSSFPKLSVSEQPLTVKEFAYFCVKVWKIKGGIGYTVFKAPRYALKELKALGAGAEVTRFKGLGEISPNEFGQFIRPRKEGDGEDRGMRLTPVSIESLKNVPKVLQFYMGKNTPERRNFIVHHLASEIDA